jgi:hypothetical protein
MRRSRSRCAFAAITSMLLAALGCNQQSSPPLITLAAPATKDNPDDFKTPTPEETAAAMKVLDRAIKAHGGPERLAKLRTQVQRYKGPILNGSYLQSERELKMVSPDSLRLSVKIFVSGQILESAISFKGKVGWVSAADGKVTEMSASQSTDVLNELEFMEILSFLPLKERNYPMRPIAGEPVENRATDAIQVQRKSRLTLNLYFDRESGLLVRTHGPHFETGIGKMREVLFSDHKSFDGLVLPTRFTDVRSGETVYPDNTIDYSFPSQIDPKEFGKPGN